MNAQEKPLWGSLGNVANSVIAILPDGECKDFRGPNARKNAVRWLNRKYWARHN